MLIFSLALVVVEFLAILGWGKNRTGFSGTFRTTENNKMEVISPEKWKYYPQKNKNKKGKIGPA